MDSTTIIESLNNWKALNHDGLKLVHFLSQGNCFYYSFKASSSESIHAYPGIHNGELKFFLIPAEYDSPEYADDIAQNVTVCPVIWSYGSNRLPESVAKERIKMWDEHYKTWVPQQAATNDGIFLAFNIQSQDFEVTDTQLNLALRHDDNPTRMKADMIVTNTSLSDVAYDDYAQPVPPYGLTASAESFYLLQL